MHARCVRSSLSPTTSSNACTQASAVNRGMSVRLRVVNDRMRYFRETPNGAVTQRRQTIIKCFNFAAVHPWRSLVAGAARSQTPLIIGRRYVHQSKHRDALCGGSIKTTQRCIRHTDKMDPSRAPPRGRARFVHYLF
ncbi:hypothetical protein EVAR_90081_1 [Eumeta japonica]|uniref:Uncharacterized protein n=1 Tax=Eumeta variegata TaxID=151549 RepID=A0A4C1WZY0_EUMVA|nr:hypothetical protein EVAR_90081_1 [Eumeta japonica]